MAWGLLRVLRWALVVCFSTLLLQAWALVDDALDLQNVAQSTNIKQADSSSPEEVSTAFNGDADRFSRQTANGEGSLRYQVDEGFDSAVLLLYVSLPSAGETWELTVSVGSRAVLVLSAEMLQQELQNAQV
jgi:hypothetical protein